MNDSPPEKPKKKKRRGEALRAMQFISEIGVTVAVCLFIGVFIGRFLDERLHTSPWLLLTFSLIGAGAAFKMLLEVGTKK